MSSILEQSDAEIIEFKQADETRTLYVSNILTNGLDIDQIKEHLDSVFSEYGVLCSVIVNQSQFNDDDDNNRMTKFYALVMFFSRQAALRAYKNMKAGLVIDDPESKAKVRFARKRSEKSTPLDQTLYLPKCVMLANHYLGFNGWSSDIVSLGACGSEPGFAEFLCVVRITVHDDVPLISEGVGSAKEVYDVKNPVSRLSSHCKAKKLSHQRASMAAFSRILLVVTSSGKVYAEVDSTNVQTNDHLTLNQSHLIQVQERATAPLEDSLEADHLAQDEDEDESCLLMMQLLGEAGNA